MTLCTHSQKHKVIIIRTKALQVESAVFTFPRDRIRKGHPEVQAVLKLSSLEKVQINEIKGLSRSGITDAQKHPCDSLHQLVIARWD